MGLCTDPLPSTGERRSVLLTGLAGWLVGWLVGSSLFSGRRPQAALVLQGRRRLTGANPFQPTSCCPPCMLLAVPLPTRPPLAGMRPPHGAGLPSPRLPAGALAQSLCCLCSTGRQDLLLPPISWGQAVATRLLPSGNAPSSTPAGASGANSPLRPGPARPPDESLVYRHSSGSGHDTGKCRRRNVRSTGRCIS